jgi:hypothetical protein
LEIGGGGARLVVEQGRETVRIDARRRVREGGEARVGLLRAPLDGAMKGRVAESLDAEVEVLYTIRDGWWRGERVLLHDVGRCAGLQVEARPERLGAKPLTASA